MFSLAREKGDPIMRGLGAFNWKDKSIFLLASINEGDKVRFTLPPDFEIVEEVISNAEKIKQDEIPLADALLMFSCIGRLGHLADWLEMKLEHPKGIWNVPMVGVFSYGEYGKSKTGTI